ncbi:uncharacterized protein BO97DRAFT_451934 [Aspergillus homomorphus CBS 101889]|uniref:Uncharacterized protein n=1 Tax=Aspergillus homomorphus (strain CBS 101889) TaxID=1450537 RepID=A0A395HYL5_ASPHC|nr:hypothetical protein BO97DRAFT_451934 [Aspergillus homomorphus CBS 101889]RAL12545.1 hypothetical protein BO97DRAFT_451934 [Aspergillus homomorphus CBS 101889]
MVQYDYLPGLNMSEIAELKAELEHNPTPEQLETYVRDRTWSNATFPQNATITAACSDELWFPQSRFLPGGTPNRTLAFPIDHCLSQKTGDQCRLLYHMPIGVVLVICILLKVVCMTFLVNIDRHNRFLTIGDAISSYLQRPDSWTVNWCMLSKSTVKTSTACPWGDSCDPEVRGGPLPLPPHPGKPSTKVKLWSKACKAWVVLSIFPLLGGYIAITQILPEKAQAAAGNLDYSDVRITQVWNIKGFGSVQSGALLTNLATTYVGMELLANTPQFLISLLYMPFNDCLTRMLHAVDYSTYAVARRPLRVSFPEGQQRSTFYLAIPYRYSLPLLLTFTLIHFFISEGLFYVQILPYDLAGQPLEAAVLMTCAVSTIPLEIAMFLTIIILLVIWVLSGRRHKCRAMPFAIGCSVAISAACHPPPGDAGAAFKPVMWGAVKDGEDPAVASHCCFTSLEVTEPLEDHLYA